MRTVTTIALLLCMVSCSTLAQISYSADTLENASSEELEIYLLHVTKLKNAGSILMIAGPLAFLSAYPVGFAGYFANSKLIIGLGVIMLFAGPAATVIGIPLHFINKSKVNRINGIIRSRGVGPELSLSPVCHLDPQSERFYPRIRLSINF